MLWHCRPTNFTWHLSLWVIGPPEHTQNCKQLWEVDWSSFSGKVQNLLEYCRTVMMFKQVCRIKARLYKSSIIPQTYQFPCDIGVFNISHILNGACLNVARVPTPICMHLPMRFQQRWTTKKLEACTNQILMHGLMVILYHLCANSLHDFATSSFLALIPPWLRFAETTPWASWGHMWCRQWLPWWPLARPSIALWWCLLWHHSECSWPLMITM